jgi:hypothetical protein
MPDEPQDMQELKHEDVESVSEKLKEWVPSLPEQEQLVLGWILTRAAAANDEAALQYAQQVGAGVPVSALTAEAAGLSEVTGYQSNLSIDKIGPVKIWTYRW